MALDRGTTFIELRAKLDQFRNDLAEAERMATGSGRNLEQKLRGVSDRMVNLGKTATVGVTLPIVGLGVAAGKAAAEAAKNQAQLAAVLKSTGGAANVSAKQVNALATSLAETTTFEDDAVIAGQNLLLTFKNIRNEAGRGNDIFNQTTEIMTDMSAALGQDMQSSAIQLGKALNDPIRGVTALQRVGVSFTEKQREQIKTLVESGRTMDAQKLILGELRDQFGGVAEAQAKTPWGQTQQAMNTMGEALESLGTAMAPFVAQLAEWLKRITGWFQNLSPEMKRWVVIIGAAVAAIGPLLIVGGKLIQAFLAIRKAWMVLQVALAANPFVAIGLAVAALVILIVKNWDKIKEWTIRTFKAIWEFIEKAWLKINQVSRDIVGQLLAWLVRAFANFVEFWAKVAGAIVNTAAKAFGWVPGIGDKIKRFRDNFNATTDAIVEGLRNQADEFQAWGEESRRNLKETNKVARQTLNIIEGIAQAVKAIGAISVGVSGPGRGDGLGIVPIGAANTPTGMFNVLAPAVPGGQRISSGYRPGAITSSGNPSLHAIPPPWNAVDVVGENLLQFAQAAAASFGPRLRELIYTPLGFSIKNGVRTSPIAASDHYDHVHLADFGAIIKGPAWIRQGNITEAHIPLSGPGAGPIRIVIEDWERGMGYLVLNTLDRAVGARL